MAAMLLNMGKLLTWLLLQQGHDCAGYPGCQRGSPLADPWDVHEASQSDEHRTKSAPWLHGKHSPQSRQQFRMLAVNSWLGALVSCYTSIAQETQFLGANPHLGSHFLARCAVVLMGIPYSASASADGQG